MDRDSRAVPLADPAQATGRGIARFSLKVDEVPMVSKSDHRPMALFRSRRYHVGPNRVQRLREKRVDRLRPYDRRVKPRNCEVFRIGAGEECCGRVLPGANPIGLDMTGAAASSKRFTIFFRRFQLYSFQNPSLNLLMILISKSSDCRDARTSTTGTDSSSKSCPSTKGLESYSGMPL